MRADCIVAVCCAGVRYCVLIMCYDESCCDVARFDMSCCGLQCVALRGVAVGLRCVVLLCDGLRMFMLMWLLFCVVSRCCDVCGCAMALL